MRPTAPRLGVLLGCAAALPAATFVAAPAAVFWPNRTEFAGGAADVLGPAAALAALWTVACWGVLATLRGPARLAVASTLLVLGLVAHVQAQILVHDPPPLTGGSLSFDDRSGEALADVGATLAALAAAFVGRRWLVRNLAAVTVVALGWILASAAVTPFATRVPARRLGPSAVAASYRALTELSPERNVVHVMLDSLQGDLLAALLVADPAARAELSGFTFFRDHAGYAMRTVLSLPRIFSGRGYFEEPFDSRTSMPRVQALLGAGYLGELRAAGWRVSLLAPSMHLCPPGIDECLDLVSTIAWDTRGARVSRSILGWTPPVSTESVFIGDLALLRVAPTPLKPAVYRAGSWLLSDLARDPARRHEAILNLTVLERQIPQSVALFRRYCGDLRVHGTAPAYHFVHVLPPHQPFVLDQTCATLPLSIERRRGLWKDREWADYWQQGACTLRLFRELVARLRALGLYDSSAIILQADTGEGLEPNPERGAAREPAAGLTPGEVRAYAHPALLIKPPGASGELRVSDAPTDHSLTRATVLRFAGLPVSDPGCFDLGPEPRVRTFVTNKGLVTDNAGVGLFHRYSIDGAVRDPGSWRDEGVFRAFGEPVSGVDR